MDWRPYDYSSRWHRLAKRALYRPLLDIEVSTDLGPETFSALVDSGTEVTIMNSEIAQLLNINPVGKKPAGVFMHGDTRNFEKVGFLAEVNITVPEFPSEVITTTVIFADGMGSNPFEILLGQDDFFRRFLVKFEKSRNKFHLALPQ